MRVVREYIEGGGEGLLVDALRVVGGGRAPLLLLPAEAHGVHLQHRLDVDLEANEGTEILSNSGIDGQTLDNILTITAVRLAFDYLTTCPW